VTGPVYTDYMTSNTEQGSNMKSKKWDHDEYCETCEATVEATVFNGWIVCDNCNTALFEVAR